MSEIVKDLVRVELAERLPARIFHTRGTVLHTDRLCIVQHNGTTEVGRVLGAADDWIDDETEIDPREVIVREATPEDLERHRENQALEAAACRFCLARVRSHGLDMKVSRALYSLDRTKLRIFFTSENRIDFRDLVRDLAAEFKTRIEMRQIGVRDESRMVGGLGVCGLELCCSRWLVKLVPISIKMAKEQNLALNPPNISGMCGRLLCCLSYEYETYRGLRKQFPRIGARVIFEGQEGIVKDVNLLRRTVSVEAGGRMQTFSIDTVTIERPEPPPQPPAGERTGKRRRRRRKSGEAPGAGGDGKEPEQSPPEA